MRRRVMIPLLIFGLLTVCAILVPVGAAITRERTQQLQLQRSVTIDRIMQRATGPLDTGDTGALTDYLDRLHDVYGERAVVLDDAGRVVAGSERLRGRDDVARAVSAALRGVSHDELRTILPCSPDVAVLASPVMAEGTSPVGAVVLEADLSVAKGDVTRGLALAGAAGVGVLAAVLLASVWWTRWVLRPVRALDLAANALAEQKDHEPPDAGGPPELRRLARSFERMAEHVEAALRQQRGLVADTSHQLRNPLAAVRIRIDALSAAGPDEVRVEAQEIEAIDHDLDRLEGTVTRLLELAHAEHRATTRTAPSTDPATAATGGDTVGAEAAVPASALADPHRASLAEAGLSVETFGGAARAAFLPEDLDQVVEILLDNARKYAGDGATVRIGWETQAATTTLSVSDSGRGLSDPELDRIGTRFWRSPRHAGLPGSGLGHAIVAELARANHATVEIDRAPEGGLRTRIRMATA